MSLGCNYYGLVIVDDYSRFTWTLFIPTKDEAYHAFKRFAKVIKNEKNCGISQTMGENSRMRSLTSFSSKFGIKHNFSAPRTPQQNGVVERKNRSLETSKDTLE